MVTYMEPHTVPTYMSVKCTRRTLRMPSFTRAPHAQPSLSNFTRWDSDFGEPTRSRGTTRLEQNFPTSPQNKKDQTYTSFAIHVIANNINPTCKLNVMLTLIGLPQGSQPGAFGGILQPQTGPLPGPPGSYLSRVSAHKFKPNKITIIVIPTYLNC